MTNQKEQGQRLERLLESLEINQSALARRIRVSPSLVNQITKGQKALSHRVLSRLTNSYTQVNANWLLNGEGDMFLEKKVIPPPPEAGILTGVMEPEPPKYGKASRNGIFEAALGRIAELERRMKEMEDEIEVLRKELEDCKGVRRD